MTKIIFTLNEHSNWQVKREAHIISRKGRIKQKYLGDPRAQFRAPIDLEPSTYAERRKVLPITYEHLDEITYAEVEVYLMQIQEDEVTF